MNDQEPLLPGTGERARLDDLVRTAAMGRGGALRIVGGRGTGKSSAIDYAIDQAVDFRVVRIRAVAAEHEIPYAALHLICVDLLDTGSRPPVNHREVLDTPLGLAGRSRPEATAVARAALQLLDGITETQPVCIAVDDAQWLDATTAEVLVFIAGHADGRALLIVVADDATNRSDRFDGLPAMRIQPLGPSEVRRRLLDVVPGPMDAVVAERVLAESHGNMRVLVESLQGLTAAELAGGFAIPAPRRTRSCAHRQYCHDQTTRLTPTSRRLLLAAAADSTGDIDLFHRLVVEWGADAEDLIKGGLLEVGDRVAFACPDVRSVIYHSATPDDRRLVHRKLGEHTIDPAWRSWHLGLASDGYDDPLADELESHAGPVQSRGGAAARAAFLEKAARLTSDRDRRADRAMAASAAQYDCGDVAGAQRILGMVETAAKEPARHARQRWHRARIETVVHPGRGSATDLLNAARRLRSLDAADAREAYLEAFLATMSSTEQATDGTLTLTATEARQASADHLDHPADQMLYGLAIRVLDGYARSVRPLRAAISAFRFCELDFRATRWLGLAALIAADLWDEPAWRDLTRLHLPAGTAGNRALPIGDDGSFIHMVPRFAHDAAVAEAVAVAAAHNAAGRYEQAVEAVRETVRSEDPAFTGWALGELVEAAVRTGENDLAEEAAARLFQRTTPAGTDWALGVQATAEALLAHNRHAEAHYEQAIERLSRAGVRPQLARAELLYGEWLRRQNRRVDARFQLRAASEHFTAFGGVAFVERARGELLATGGATRKRAADSRRQLTPQEARVASLARAGFSNAEIAEQLFVSKRTVEYHLYKAFAKLDVNSRGKLQTVPDL